MTSQKGSAFVVFLLVLAIAVGCQGLAGPDADPGQPGPPAVDASTGTPTADDSPHVGAMCEIGSAVIGFDAEGHIICAPVGTQDPEASPVPTADTSPPNLSAFDFDPKVVSIANGPAEITFTARIVDDLSGNAPGAPTAEGIPGENGPSTQARFASPGDLHFFFVLFGEAHRVSGDALDGVYEYVATIPEYVERGEWVMEELTLADEAGNNQTLGQDEARALGLPTTFLVE